MIGAREFRERRKRSGKEPGKTPKGLPLACIV
jgi:hypothetical protein